MGRPRRVRRPQELADVARYLDRDPRANIAPRSYLISPAGLDLRREVFRLDGGPEEGILILAHRSAWTGLPRIWRMVAMDAGSPEALAMLLAGLPARKRMCFLLQRPWFTDQVTPAFPGEWFKSEIYHCLGPGEFQPYRRWLVAELGGRHAAVVARSEGWTRYVLANLRFPEDKAWGVIEDERVIGSCFCTQIVPGLVSICAVYTAEHRRGRGVARSVVTAAAEAIMAEAKTPFYCADEDNAASRRVAESLGFKPYLEHRRWLGQKAAPLRAGDRAP